MKIIDLYRDYGVDFMTEGHRHTRPGWVNTSCPFCTGNPGYHLGFDTTDEKFYCWRCGWHPIDESISELIGVSVKEAQKIVKQYHGRTHVKKPKIIARRKATKFPSDTGMLLPSHKNYLIKRNFDPEELYKVWGVMGTGPTATLDGVSYKNRILAPIYWNGELVSFQTRDISGRAKEKYLACMKAREKIHHKHILYGKQSGWKDTGLIVEGITDAWALGVEAAAVFGISYKIEQVNHIARNFKRAAICFDPDPQAIKQAKRLVAQLKIRGIEAWRVPLDTDPADMPEDDRKHLRKIIL